MDYAVYYGIGILTLIITLLAQFFVTHTYKKYAKVLNKKKLSGREVARKILDKHDLKDIYIVETRGFLTDHYDPSRKVIRLSTDVYNNESVGSVAVAAHECGHAIQDKEKYTFMRIRASLVPIVNFSSYAGYIAIVIGIIANSINIIWLGIALEAVILLFQLVTLPVEVDASKKALKELEEMKILTEEEHREAKTTLIAAAMTYIASIATTLLEIFRLIIIYGGRRDD